MVANGFDRDYAWRECEVFHQQCPRPCSQGESLEMVRTHEFPMQPLFAHNQFCRDRRRVQGAWIVDIFLGDWLSGLGLSNCLFEAVCGTRLVVFF